VVKFARWQHPATGHKISNICHITGRRIEAPKAPRSSAEGARMGCGERVSLSHWRWGLGMGLCPLPRKFLDF